MFGNLVKSVLVGVAALLIVQGSALGAMVNVSDLEGTLTLDSVNVTALYSASHPIAGGGPINDEFLVDFNIGTDAISSVLFTTPGASNPTGLDLALYLVTGISGGVITFDDLTTLASGAGSFAASGLVSGQQYLLKVVANASGQGIRSYNGEITATPLPPALVIFGTGLFGLGFLSRYRRKRQGQLGLQA